MTGTGLERKKNIYNQYRKGAVSTAFIISLAHTEILSFQCISQQRDAARLWTWGNYTTTATKFICSFRFVIVRSYMYNMKAPTRNRHDSHSITTTKKQF